MKKLYLLILIIFTFFSLSATNHRDSINIIHYNINLSILDFSSEHIEGFTCITLSPKFDNTKNFKLDLLSLNVDKIIVKNHKNNWSYNDSIINITLKKTIDKKDTISIIVYYNGTPKRDADWGGFYFSSKDAFNMGVGMASIPHSFGRVWFPCNDNFTDKATYEYNITVNKKYTVACGGILKNTTNSSSNKNLKIYHWKQNKQIPTYLASVNIADYSIIKDTYKGIKKDFPVEIYSYSNNVEKTKKTIVDLNSALTIFEKLFGAYSWDKIGYSQVSFSSGAMEHAENIAMSSFAFDGTTNNETLLYHELSHSWFGNLVTCKSAKDMWLNEGWASYCEALFLENMYGQEKFLDYNRNRHLQTLFMANKNDNGYRSVANMNINYTYGTTVYKKGADVVHTLRFYLGDSLFFPAVKKYLQKYAFSNASTEDLKTTLSKETGVNLDDFFNFWLYSSGFPFFEIYDWKIIENNNNNYRVSVKMKQRIIGGKNLANSNRIEVFFMDSNLNTVKKIFVFSGDSATQIFNLHFKPVLVTPDLNEHIADATIDKSIYLSKNGDYSFKNCLFKTEIKNISENSFLRVTCNCIEPEKLFNENFLLQKNYYWTIEGIWNKDFKAFGKFYLTRLMDDNFTKRHSKNEIILVYRKSLKQKWHQIKYTFNTNYLETPIKTGQYALAIKI